MEICHMEVVPSPHKEMISSAYLQALLQCWVNWSQILNFKRQLRVFHFLKSLWSQIVLSNLNHSSSSPSPQTHAVHYISAEIHCSLLQQSLWSPWKLICTPASKGVSPGQLVGDHKTEIYPRGHRWLSEDIFFLWEWRNLQKLPQNKGLLRLSVLLSGEVMWAWPTRT